MRPTLARAVRDHEAAGNAVDEAVAEAVWADGEGEAAAMGVVDDAPAMGAVDEAAVAEAVGEGGRVKSGRPRETQQQKLARIKRELEAVPTEPGVYLWKDAAGEVIYVGKAKQLRARMRQYVNFQDDRAKIPLLVEAIDSFDYLVVDNEHEALVLEKNLINQYSPFFNADFKDNKSYPFIALTKGDVFPAIKYTREKHKSDTKYFGPFTDARAAREMIDIARRVVPLCAATCADWRGLTRALEKDPLAFLKRDARPCFDCHVGLGPGACCGAVTPEEYAQNVRRIERFLAGNHREFVDELTAEMQEAAAELDFERAGRLKARIDTINSLADKQHAVSSRDLSADVVGFFREETVAGVNVLVIREGRIVNANEFILNRGTDVPDQDLLRNFLMRYYDTTTSIPREVIVRALPEDAEVMGEWLTGKLDSAHGAKVRFTAPQKGEKADLLTMAETNARHTLMRYKVRTNYDDKRINNALLQLESALALDAPPMRIECFDISTIHGSYTVASMVVFTGGKPDKNQYRRFKIKTPLDEANDFLSMQEVMRRRYAPARLNDERFGSKPAAHHPGRRKAAADGGARHVRGDGDRRHRHLRSGQARRGAVRALAGHGPGGAALRLGVAVSGEAGARRGPPLRHHLPPRAARQGHDGEHSGRRGGTGPRAEEGADEALQVVQELESCQLGGNQGRQGHPRRGGRGAGARSRAV